MKNLSMSYYKCYYGQRLTIGKLSRHAVYNIITRSSFRSYQTLILSVQILPLAIVYFFMIFLQATTICNKASSCVFIISISSMFDLLSPINKQCITP